MRTLLSRVVFRSYIAFAAVSLLIAGCGESAGQAVSGGDGGAATTASSATASSTLPGVYDGFRLVGEEAVGLNGRENEDRPPIQFLLLASEADSGLTEPELVDLYVIRLEEAGWSVISYATDDDWWTVQGNKGGEFVRVGPASLFHERAKISEGYSRTVFRELAAEHPGPMIVVSVDPAG